MSFNPDASKQSQEIIFSQKLKKVAHHPLFFNSANVSQCKSQKHLGLKIEDHYIQRSLYNGIT